VLVLELVGDDALEAHRERGPVAPSSEEKAVEIDAVDEVRLPRGPERDACVVEPAIEGVKAGADAQRSDVEPVPKCLEPPPQSHDADEGATPLPRIGRRGGENGDAQRTTSL